MKSISRTMLVVVALVLVGTVVNVNAQEAKKHELRAFYGTSFASKRAEGIAQSLAAGLLGSAQKSETSTFGMVGVGYRYHIGKFGLGMDLGFSTAKEEWYEKQNDTKPFETYNMKRIFVLPTASFSYYSNHIIDVYCSASAGLFMQNKKSDLKGAKATNTNDFSWQVNPVGLKVSYEGLGAFIELGYGHKGIISGGLSFSL